MTSQRYLLYNFLFYYIEINNEACSNFSYEPEFEGTLWQNLLCLLSKLIKFHHKTSSDSVKCNIESQITDVISMLRQ